MSLTDLAEALLFEMQDRSFSTCLALLRIRLGSPSGCCGLLGEQVLENLAAINDLDRTIAWCHQFLVRDDAK